MTDLKNLPHLHDRLKHIRLARGLSQIELAELCGTTQQAIQQAEAGKAKQPRYLHKLSLALDIPFEWLTMNVISKKAADKPAGFSERGREVLDTFFAMPKKDQTLLLELMKSRQKNNK